MRTIHSLYLSSPFIIDGVSRKSGKSPDPEGGWHRYLDCRVAGYHPDIHKNQMIKATLPLDPLDLSSPHPQIFVQHGHNLDTAH